MDAWFDRIAAMSGLSAASVADLDETGFTLASGSFQNDALQALAAAYDAAMASPSTEPFRRVGRTSARLSGLVDHSAAFDAIYLHPLLLAAAALVIGQPFRLSSLLARTLLANRSAPPLHVDCAADAQGWPLASFILMIDDFTADNGATRFLPGSHRTPAGVGAEVQACGPAGTLILYNGSVLHEHGANHTDRPRRSIQGAFVRRSFPAAPEPAWRVSDETRARLSPLARYLLDLD